MKCLPSNYDLNYSSIHFSHIGAPLFCSRPVLCYCWGWTIMCFLRKKMDKTRSIFKGGKPAHHTQRLRCFPGIFRGRWIIPQSVTPGPIQRGFYEQKTCFCLPHNFSKRQVGYIKKYIPDYPVYAHVQKRSSVELVWCQAVNQRQGRASVRRSYTVALQAL